MQHFLARAELNDQESLSVKWRLAFSLLAASCQCVDVAYIQTQSCWKETVSGWIKARETCSHCLFYFSKALARTGTFIRSSLISVLRMNVACEQLKAVFGLFI